MTRFINSEFSRSVSLARFCPQMTIKAAKESARAHGFTIRRDVDGADGFDVFPKGQGDYAQFAECPAEAEFMAAARARDFDESRTSLVCTPSIRAMAEELAARACVALELAAGSIRVDVSSDVKFKRPRVNFCDAESGRVVSSGLFTPERCTTASDIAGRLAASVEYAAEELAAECDQACIEAIAEGVTIEETGPDWMEGGRPVDGCDWWYAQDSDGADGKPGLYAFGATPYAALRALEAAIDPQAATALAPAATGARSLSAAATPPELLGGYSDGPAGRYARTVARAMREDSELAEALAEFWEWEDTDSAPARLSEAEARRMITGGHVAQIAMPF